MHCSILEYCRDDDEFWKSELRTIGRTSNSFAIFERVLCSESVQGSESVSRDSM